MRALAASLLVLVGSAQAERPSAPGTEPAAEPVPIAAADTKRLEERWGIRVDAIRLTSAGYMLDFRYRVVDAEKAAPLFKRQIKPVLLDEETGALLVVPTPPKTGPLRTSNPPIEGRMYFMLFGNPGRFVTAGRKVTITVGEFRITGLVVQEGGA